MPGLDTAAVRDWLRHHDPAVLGALKSSTQSVEETEEVSAALRRCGTALDEALESGSGTLAALLCSGPARDDLRQVLAQLGVGPALRLFWWIGSTDMADPDAVISSLCTADPTGSGQFLDAALAEAARPALMSRLFAPERLADLVTACTQLAQVREAA